jgi:hypothetical protein
MKAAARSRGLLGEIADRGYELGWRRGLEHRLARMPSPDRLFDLWAKTGDDHVGADHQRAVIGPDEGAVFVRFGTAADRDRAASLPEHPGCLEA